MELCTLIPTAKGKELLLLPSEIPKIQSQRNQENDRYYQESNQKDCQ